MFKSFANHFISHRLINRLVLIKTTKNDKNIKQFGKYFSTQTTKTEVKEENNFDIVINGGGIVGFSTFLALKSSPFLRDKRICLIERQSKPNDELIDRKDNFSNRVSSITTSSKKFLQQINVWKDFEDNAKPIKEFYVWSQKYRNAINFKLNNTLGEQNDENNDICYVIENNRILSSLQSKVSRFEDNVSYGTVVTDIKSDTNSVEIETKCLKTDELNHLKTRLLIGCDGFQSIVRQKSNLKNFEHDLEQMGVVGTIAVDSGVGNEFNEIAFQRFVPFDGSVIALLPLSQEFCSFVWSSPKDSAKLLMEMTDNQFIDHMNDSLYMEPNSSESFTEKVDEVMTRFIPKQIFENQTPRYSVPHVLSVLPESRAMFPLKFSTTLPYLVGAPNDSNNNNRIVIIGINLYYFHSKTY